VQWRLVGTLTRIGVLAQTDGAVLTHAPMRKRRRSAKDVRALIADRAWIDDPAPHRPATSVAVPKRTFSCRPPRSNPSSLT
jgi:hypothetical protein